jgi:hypothetical protein
MMNPCRVQTHACGSVRLIPSGGDDSSNDLLRTAACDFRRAGVSAADIVKLCGWTTRDMFDRYNIIDAADLTRAVRRRFTESSSVFGENGNHTATIPVAGEVGK